MALADDLIVSLGAVAGVIGWTSSTPQILAAIADANEVALDDASLKAIAKWLAGRAALVDLSTLHDFTADKASYSQSQMYKNFKDEVDRWEAEAAHFTTRAVIGEFKVHDPYVSDNADTEF